MFYSRSLIILLFNGIVSLSSLAQNTIIDSLKKDLESSKDTSRLRSLINLGLEYESIDDFANAEKLYKEALSISKKKDHKIGLASSYRGYGRLYSTKGEFNKSLEYYQKSLAIWKTMGKQKAIGAGYNQIGIVYANQGKFAEAQKYFLKNLEIIEEVGNEHEKAAAYGNVGSLYYLTLNYRKALEYFEKCLIILKSINNNAGIANIYNNMGLIYANKLDHEQALKYYKLSLSMELKEENNHGIATSYHNIGNVYLNLIDSSYEVGFTFGNYTVRQLIDSATFYQTHALDIQTLLQDKIGMARSLKSLGSLYRKQQNFKEALSKLTQALTIAKEIGAEDVIFECYKSLAFTWRDLAKCKSAGNCYSGHSIKASLAELCAPANFNCLVFRLYIHKEISIPSLTT